MAMSICSYKFGMARHRLATTALPELATTPEPGMAAVKVTVLPDGAPLTVVK